MPVARMHAANTPVESFAIVGNNGATQRTQSLPAHKWSTFRRRGVAQSLKAFHACRGEFVVYTVHEDASQASIVRHQIRVR